MVIRRVLQCRLRRVLRYSCIGKFQQHISDWLSGGTSGIGRGWVALSWFREWICSFCQISELEHLSYRFWQYARVEYFVPEAQGLRHHRDEAGISLLEDKMGMFREWALSEPKGRSF